MIFANLKKRNQFAKFTLQPKGLTMLHLMLVMLPLVTNCAQMQHDDLLSIPAEVLPHVIEFEMQARLHGRSIHIHDLVIKFVDEMPENAVGLCRYGGNDSTPEIELLRWYFQASETLHQENLVFHELGHCILLREHDNRLLRDGTYRSIMNAYLMEVYQYEAKRDYYLQELFKPATLSPYKVQREDYYEF